MTRPAAMLSSVATIFASNAGLRKPTGDTNVPSWTRPVIAPTALSVVHASMIGSCGPGMP